MHRNSRNRTETSSGRWGGLAVCVALVFAAACQASGTGAGSDAGSPDGATPHHSVMLSWNASTSPDVVGYNLYRGTTSGGPYPVKINSTLIMGVTYTDTTVMGCTTYYYVATAVDSHGVESTNSAEVAAMIPCP